MPSYRNFIKHLLEQTSGNDNNQVLTETDNAATQILIEEAGGICTDFFGKPTDYSNPLSKAENNFTLCMAPPVLHKKLQEIIHKNHEDKN